MPKIILGSRESEHEEHNDLQTWGILVCPDAIAADARRHIDATLQTPSSDIPLMFEGDESPPEHIKPTVDDARRQLISLLRGPPDELRRHLETFGLRTQDVREAIAASALEWRALSPSDDVRPLLHALNIRLSWKTAADRPPIYRVLFLLLCQSKYDDATAWRDACELEEAAFASAVQDVMRRALDRGRMDIVVELQNRFQLALPQELLEDTTGCIQALFASSHSPEEAARYSPILGISLEKVLADPVLRDCALVGMANAFPRCRIFDGLRIFGIFFHVTEEERERLVRRNLRAGIHDPHMLLEARERGASVQLLREAVEDAMRSEYNQIDTNRAVMALLSAECGDFIPRTILENCLSYALASDEESVDTLAAILDAEEWCATAPCAKEILGWMERLLCSKTISEGVRQRIAPFLRLARIEPQDFFGRAVIRAAILQACMHTQDESGIQAALRFAHEWSLTTEEALEAIDPDLRSDYAAAVARTSDEGKLYLEALARMDELLERCHLNKTMLATLTRKLRQSKEPEHLCAVIQDAAQAIGIYTRGETFMELLERLLDLPYAQRSLCLRTITAFVSACERMYYRLDTLPGIIDRLKERPESEHTAVTEFTQYFFALLRYSSGEKFLPLLDRFLAADEQGRNALRSAMKNVTDMLITIGKGSFDQKTAEEIFLLPYGKIERFVAFCQHIVAEFPPLSREISNLLQHLASHMIDVPEERLNALMTVFKTIYFNPSSEVRRMREQIMSQIMLADDPERACNAICDIFVRNNLPLIAKIYEVFRALYPEKILTAKLKSESSPRLLALTAPATTDEGSKAHAHALRLRQIYEDLLAVHVRSGNRSLRQYLEAFRQGELDWSAWESGRTSSLSDEDVDRAYYHVQRLLTLSARSYSRLGPASKILKAKTRSEKIDAVVREYPALRTRLGLKPGETFGDFLAQTFLRPARRLFPERALDDASAIDALLHLMREEKTAADIRGRDMEKTISAGTFAFEEGCFLKGVPSAYMDETLQNGVVCKEMLGAAAGSDLTPLDTDLARVQTTTKSLESTLSLAKAYGDVLLYIRDRGQFFHSQGDGKQPEGSAEKYELFRTGILGTSHYGVRTGMASTEIDALVATDVLLGDPIRLQHLLFAIVREGRYIPVIDANGRLLFSSKQFDRYRRAFAGLDRFDGAAFPLALDNADGIPPKTLERYRNDMNGIRTSMERDGDGAKRVLGEIRGTIDKVLFKHGISVGSSFDTDITRARIEETGSTARGTHIPDDRYDFDFVIKLNDKAIPGTSCDFQKIDSLVADLRQALGGTDNVSHGGENGSYQLRLAGCKGTDGGLDIDIAFVRASEKSSFGSHDAVAEKLSWIQEHHGTDARREVAANIILAKQILQRAHAYKKGDHADGGFGGIGVENWILQHGGSALSAFRAFWEAAHEDGKILPIQQFRERYCIMDPGINLKTGRHADFACQLTQKGYDGMLGAIGAYLNFAEPNQ